MAWVRCAPDTKKGRGWFRGSAAPNPSYCAMAYMLVKIVNIVAACREKQNGGGQTRCRHSFIGLGMPMLRCTPALWGEGVFSRSSDIFLFLGDTIAAGTPSLPADGAGLPKKRGKEKMQRDIISRERHKITAAKPPINQPRRTNHPNNQPFSNAWTSISSGVRHNIVVPGRRSRLLRRRWQTVEVVVNRRRTGRHPHRSARLSIPRQGGKECLQ